jgi:hypothetical protein
METVTSYPTLLRAATLVLLDWAWRRTFCSKL